MTAKLRFLLIFGMLFPFASLPQAGDRVLAPTTYYVSSSGDDNYSGLSPQEPFQTIEKVNSLTLQPGDQVLFKCGDVWQGEMLIIDSSYTTFSSYPADCVNQPTLSGSLPIDGWVPSGMANIYMADLQVGNNTNKFPYGVNQLFRDGYRLPFGRWPNLDDHVYSTIESQPGPTQFTDNELPALDWTGAIAHIRGMRWYILNREVTGQAAQTLSVGAALDCWDGCAGWGYFLNNSLSTLDQENEWFYSSSDHKVYLYSTVGTPYGIEGSVVLKDDDRFWGGITLGKDLTGKGINFVTVKNLRIRDWFRDGIALPTNLTNTEPYSITLENNTIEDVDSTGIRLMTWVYNADYSLDGWRGGTHMSLIGNIIRRANRMGIDMASAYSTVSNNTIEEIGVVENLGAAGLGCSTDDGGGMCTEDGDGIRLKVDQVNDSGNTNTISNNTLGRIAYNGIDVFGRDNHVIQNVINKACAVKGDCGAIRTFGQDSLNTSPVQYVSVQGNMIFDTLGITDGCKSEFKPLFGFGLYIDNYSNNMYVDGNTVTGSTAAGILIQNSTAMTVTDNVLYDNAIGGYYTGQIVITGSSSVVNNMYDNVFYSLRDTAWTLAADSKDQLGFSNDNYFFNPYRSDHISVQGTHSLLGWQIASGHDQFSHENWFNLSASDPPNSHLFYNDTNAVTGFDLGMIYQTLNQDFVYGSITVNPFDARVLVRPVSVPDLAVTMASTGPYDTVPGGSLEYMITVTNQGTGAAGGLVLTNPLPTGITGTGWVADRPGVKAREGSPNTWDLPDMGPGDSLTITVNAIFADNVMAGQPIAIQAQVSATTTEPQTENNTAFLHFGNWRKLFLPIVQKIEYLYHGTTLEGGR